jgi:FAD-dependent urate hydroxylase
MAEQRTDLLIVGAGPYGLALAANANHLGLDYLVVGEPMAFWRDHMPAGMYLRSASDWHLDPVGIDTIDAYLAEQGLKAADVEPLSRHFYLDYATWFQARKGISPLPEMVTRLDARSPDAAGRFQATLASGDRVTARQVVLAVGFGSFPYVPADLAAMLPTGRWGHTCDEVAFGPLAGKRVLIIGGRQSAYEWAALLREAGVAEVHVSHRQAAPPFTVSDWSWVAPIVDRMATEPGWYRGLSLTERDDIGHRLYAEGRLKLEPWLESRVLRDGIYRWPQTRLVAAVETAAGDLAVTLDTGQHLTVDHVILATGYKVQIDSLPLLAAGNLLPRLAQRNGFPVLTEHFESSVPNLYITSMPAAQDFGPFFNFTIAVRTSARVIGAAIVDRVAVH